MKADTRAARQYDVVTKSHRYAAQDSSKSRASNDITLCSLPVQIIKLSGTRSCPCDLTFYRKPATVSPLYTYCKASQASCFEEFRPRPVTDPPMTRPVTTTC